jgi:hypothetical protein
VLDKQDVPQNMGGFLYKLSNQAKFNDVND